MRVMKRFGMVGVTVLALAVSAAAEVRVSNLFSDNMVLQRDLPAPVWGMADAGEKVTVKFGEAEVSAVADAEGKWRVELPPRQLEAQPRELTIAGRNTVTIRNVLVGDVWLCSGQSNMEMALGSCRAAEDIAAADFPALRRIRFEHRTAGRPGTAVPRKWEVCSPQSAASFTAVGFYFARRVQKETGVPIGLIDNNWGGTRIEPWIAPEAIAGEPALSNVVAGIKARQRAYRDEIAGVLDSMENWMSSCRAALARPEADIPEPPQLPKSMADDHTFPSTIYHGQICPVVPYALRGALWYQGESNGNEGEEYHAKMRALIGGWRKAWNLPSAKRPGEPGGDFPFYFVQLANYMNPDDNPAGSGWARLRMAQFKSLAIPNTGMAVAIDLADAENPADIHPKNKFDVGERLALWALAKDYGKPGLVHSGPLYKAMKVEGGAIRLTFDSVGGGLMVARKEGRDPAVEIKDGKLQRFAIAGEDRKWVWASAALDAASNTVVVSSPEAPNPVAVRYAYSMNPAGCNLYNKEGLPASPFRTDDWE